MKLVERNHMASDPRDYKIDIASLGSAEQASENAISPQGTGVPYVSVMFECCKIYQRVYRRPDGKAYDGKCPRCGLPVHLAIGPGGTTSRFFTAS